MSKRNAKNGFILDKLNLGCGPTAPLGWQNVDGSWNAWFEKHRVLRSTLETLRLLDRNKYVKWNVVPIVHDLTKPLPFEDNVFSCIYASHVLEHLYLVDAKRLLIECRRVLKPGGIVRIVVPDLRFMVSVYSGARNGQPHSQNGKSTAADFLNEKLAFRQSGPPTGNVFYRLYSVWKDFHSHKWMYDGESLQHYVEMAGFKSVSQKQFLQSDIEGIADVEVAERLIDGAGVCVEGTKA